MSKQKAQLIDGKTIAEKMLLELKGQISQLNRPPGLAAILIGDDPASHRYVKKKKETCRKIGINFHDYLCGGKSCPSTTKKEILEMINFLNNDESIDGIVVQLPIPKKFATQKIIDAIDPKKDVDGFHPKNSVSSRPSRDGQKNPIVVPPLIQAIDKALKQAGENLKGKNVLIVSKNPIFADPLKQNLEGQGLAVKLTKPDENLAEKTKQADILITVVGQPGLIKKSMVRQDAVIIDAGTTLVGENKWKGDADPKVAEIASWLTPVPGGVGPLTVAYLLKNTVELAKKNQS